MRWKPAAAASVLLTALIGFLFMIAVRSREGPESGPDAGNARLVLPAGGSGPAIDPSRNALDQAGVADRGVETLTEAAAPPGFTLRVLLVDQLEEPVDEVKVTVWSTHWSATSDWTPDHPLVSVSRGDGQCEFERVLPGSYSVTAWPTRHKVKQLDVELSADSEVVLRLEAAPHVVGRAYVRDRSHPLQFGTIRIATGMADGSGWEPLSIGRTTRTDAEARFAVGPFEPGDHEITLVHREFRCETLPVRLTRAAPIQEIEVVFVDGVIVRGTVQNRQGLVLPGERILWLRAGNHPSTGLECRSDGNGRYEQGGLRPGKHIAEVLGVALHESRTQEVILTGEPVQDVPITVDCPRAVRVRVLTRSGEPAVGARVEYDFRIPGRTGMFTAEPLDGGGWTSIPCAPPGTNLQIEATDNVEGMARLTYVVTPRNEPAVLHLEALEDLRGEVVNAEGQPIADLEVSATHPEDLRSKWAKTDAAGRFEMALGPGIYRVEVKPGRHGAAAGEVEVGQGRTPERLRLVVRLDPTRTARVHVLDPDGEPLEGATVRLTSRVTGWPELTGLTDGEGWIPLPCEPGDYDVGVTSGGLRQFDPATVSIPRAPTAEVQMERPEARSVHGQVLVDGKPVAGARVGYALPKGGWTESAHGLSLSVTDDDGRYSLCVLRGDAIYVLARREDFAVARSELVQVPRRGQVADVLVRAIDGMDLHLKLEDSDGASPGHIVVGLNQEDPPFDWQGPTDADGTLTVPRLPLGEYRVTFVSTQKDFLPGQRLTWTGGAGTITLQVETEPR